MLLLIRERVGRPARQIQIGEDMDILAAGGAGRLAMTRFFDQARRAITSGATVGEFAYRRPGGVRTRWRRALRGLSFRTAACRWR